MPYQKNESITLLVSVVMPVYNGAEFIDESVKSVIEQTHTNWELIIVDDGSDDESLKRIECWADKDTRIKAFQHPGGVNKGVSATRNLAIAKSKGKYVATLDCDDVWYHQKLENDIQVVRKNPDIVFVYSKAEVIDEFGDLIINKPDKLVKANRKPVFGSGKTGKLINPFQSVMQSTFVVPTSSAFFLRETSLECGNFDESTGSVEDTLLWYQLTEKGNIYFIDKILVQYRIHSAQWNARTRDAKLLIGRRLLLFSYLLKVAKFSNKKIVSYQLVNVGFGNIVRYFILFPEKDLEYIYNKFLEVWKSGDIFLIHKIMTIYVLLYEFLILPLRLINLLFKRLAMHVK